METQKLITIENKLKLIVKFYFPKFSKMGATIIGLYMYSVNLIYMYEVSPINLHRKIIILKIERELTSI